MLFGLIEQYKDAEFGTSNIQILKYWALILEFKLSREAGC